MVDVWRLRRGILILCVAMLCVSWPGPMQASNDEGGLETLSVGDCSVSVDRAKKSMVLTWREQRVEGKGSACWLRAEKDGTSSPASKGEKGDLLAFAIHAGDEEWPVILGILNPTSVPILCRVPMKAIGLSGRSILAGYDMNRDAFMPPLSGALAQIVTSKGYLLVAVNKVGKQPILLSSSEALSAGQDKVAWQDESSIVRGTSSLRPGGKVEIRMLAPSSSSRWVAKEALLGPSGKSKGASIRLMQTGPWLRCQIASPEEGTLDWEIRFERQKACKAPLSEVSLSAKPVAARRVQLTCYSQGQGVLIRRSDGMAFIPSGTWWNDDSVSPNAAYTYEVFPLSWSKKGRVLASAAVQTAPLPPIPLLPDVYVSDLQPQKAVNGWNGDPRRDASIEDNPIRIRGEIFAKGMGVHAVSELVYAIAPGSKRFVAVVGVDDEKNDASGSVTFEVYADDAVLFKSPTVTPANAWINVDVALPQGAKILKLVVGDGGDGVGCDHADWANAGFITKN